MKRVSTYIHPLCTSTISLHLSVNRKIVLCSIGFPCRFLLQLRLLRGVNFPHGNFSQCCLSSHRPSPLGGPHFPAAPIPPAPALWPPTAFRDSEANPNLVAAAKRIAVTRKTTVYTATTIVFLEILKSLSLSWKAFVHW